MIKNSIAVIAEVSVFLESYAANALDVNLDSTGKYPVTQ
jgi:hypothetical protein